MLKAPRFFYAILVIIAACLVLIPAAPDDLVPGDSASLVAQHAGIDVFAPLSHNLWGKAASLVAKALPGSTGFRWNVFSALCGAASCGMLVLIGARLPKLNPQWALMVKASRAMANLSGLAAGLLLLGALPFRIAAGAASPQTFELLMLLIAVWLLIRYGETGHAGYAAIACAIYSLASSQSVIALVLAPAFVFGCIYFLWHHQQASVKRVGLLLVSFSAPALIVVTAVALRFSQLPDAAWTGLEGPLKIIYQMLQEMYFELRSGAPLLTVIILTIYCLIPFAMILSLTSGRRQGELLVYPFVTVLGALLFLNFRLAPFPLVGMNPLMVSAYAIAALWLGYLSAYMIGATQATTLSHNFLRRHPRTAGVLAMTGFAALVVFISLAGMRSHRNLHIDAAAGVTRLAAAIAGQANDGDWIILHGELDPLTRIKVHESQRRPLIISGHRMTHPPYQRALAAAMPSPRLASLAETGLAPLLRERIHPDHGPAPRIAILGEPGLLRYIVNTAWPDRALYWSVEPSGLEAGAYLAAQQTWWSALPFATGEHPYRGLEERLRRTAGRMANDAGVWLEDQDAPDLARAAYREAIRIDEDNLSARLNLREIEDQASPEFKELETGIETLSARYRGRHTLASLIDRHGLIRHPAASEALDRRWKRSASANQLDPRVAKLLEHPDEDVVANAAQRLLKDDPAVLLNFARLANGNNRPALAQRILDILPETGPLAKPARVERAQTAMLMGEQEVARKILAGIPNHEMDDPRAFIMLALLSLETDPEQCDRHLAQLEAFPGRLPDLSLPIARLYEARGNREMAARHLEYLAARQPLNATLHHQLIRLYLEDQAYDRAYAAARSLLAVDTRDPWANTALAVRLKRDGATGAADAARAIALLGDPGMEKFLNPAENDGLTE